MKMKLNSFVYLSTFTVLFLMISSSVFSQSEAWVAPPESEQLVSPYSSTDAAAAARGKKIYEKLCWTCHGKLGVGDGPMSKSLDPKPANHTSEKVQSQTDGAIYWKITNGKGLMASYKNLLSKNERWQLVTYIRQLGAK